MEVGVGRRATALGDSIDNVLIAAGVRATEQLKSSWPKLSAATLNKLTNAVPLLLGVLALAAMCTTPSMIVLSIFVVLPTAFRIWVVTHSVATRDQPTFRPFPTATNEEWPVYSIIAPLRGEARMVDQLLSAIERFDYPSEKLDVILAVEADDSDTRAAITARQHRIPITVIPSPPAELRTKPKALNVALPFARGIFTVIYDAEDRPERNQLRRALRAFRSADGHLACVQARLCTETNTSWLSCYFSAEYAAHFDIFLPKLAALELPLPLGGSSNHFRTATLREVGGWDPHNVTEDADLGMRLARFGYRSGVIDSTTYEEAPANVCDWLGQRSRWFKGWMRLVKNLFFGMFSVA
jgi:glycosyltransferase XagB